MDGQGNRRLHEARSRAWPAALAAILLLARGAMASEAATASAAQWLDSIRPSAELQAFLDRTIDASLAHDAALRAAKVRVALLDLTHGEPRLADHHGDAPIYPASVVKFVYLMAAYRWQELGRLRIEGDFDRELSAMIRESSNQATQKVFARLTDTEPGPELPPEAYRDFRDRRLAVKDWLASLGIHDLHCVNPTYDGNGDLFGRDAQFIGDASVAGGLGGSAPNRQSMTATGTAKLLALLATDRALTPADSAAVRLRMRRDPNEQRHLVARIAGGAARLGGLEVYAKSGTWGPIYADAGIVRHLESGRQMVVVVFTEASPAYRGNFIADLTERSAEHLLIR
jgi:beta-lactamase class A